MPIRILVEPGTYNCLNLGDVAMLQVAVSRLARLIPSATLQVITDTPDRLARYCPNAIPVSASALRIWLEDDLLLGRFERLFPAYGVSYAPKVKPYIRRRWPRLLEAALHCTRPLDARPGELPRFLDALDSADCVIVCGQGFLTDHVGKHALATLNLLAAAKAKRIPYFLLGQGIGPLTDKTIIGRSRTVLPDAKLVSLREQLAGVPFCRSIQVPREKCLVTGDEAVELAYRRQYATRGKGLGINVRLSPSSGLTENVLPMLAAVLNRFARTRQLEYVPLPIARDHKLRDVQSIRILLSLTGCESDGGVYLETPEAIISEASRCRVVLTGAYHAAVFALSQGVPAVCIAKSNYFRVKFEGLADQFGTGCTVISLDEANASGAIFEALVRAWDGAPWQAETLRRAAVVQILKSYRVYNRLGRFLRSKFPEDGINALEYPIENRGACVCAR